MTYQNSQSPIDQLRDLASSQVTKLEATRQRNRERMPQVSKFIDEVRAVFGEVKVLYAREGDYEVGVSDYDRIRSLLGDAGR